MCRTFSCPPSSEPPPAGWGKLCDHMPCPAAFAARGIPLEPLVTIRDLGIEPDAA